MIWILFFGIIGYKLLDFLTCTYVVDYGPEVEKTFRKLLTGNRIVLPAINNNIQWDHNKKSIIRHINIGKHICFYKYVPIILNLTPLHRNQTDAEDKFKLKCTTLIIFTKILDEFCEMLAQSHFIQNEKHVYIYHMSFEYPVMAWHLLCTKPGRTLDTVFINNEIKDKLIKDIREFFQSKDWYTSKGIPYRRGYLLHGPTGSGKSSLITAICSTLNLNIYYISLSNSRLNNDKLIKLLNSIPSNQLILIDDIDYLIKRKSKTRKIDKFGTGITMNGLLNALDGPMAHTNHVIFFTSNLKRSELDSSFLRPGRIDFSIEMGNIQIEDIKLLFEHFYTNKDDNRKKIKEFAKNYAENVINLSDITMCQILNHLIVNKNNPQNAVNTATAHEINML